MLAAGWERWWAGGSSGGGAPGIRELPSYYHALLELLLGDLAVIVDIPLRSGTQSQQGCCR